MMGEKMGIIDGFYCKCTKWMRTILFSESENRYKDNVFFNLGPDWIQFDNY